MQGIQIHTYKVSYTGKQRYHSTLGSFLIDHAKYFEVKNYSSSEDALNAAQDFYKKEVKKVTGIGYGEVTLTGRFGLRDFICIAHFMI